MPRTYQRKTLPKYCQKDLEDARKMVENGESIYSASKSKGVPFETLRRWIVSPPTRAGSGRPTVLTEKEELLIVRSLQFTAKCGYPMDRSDVLCMVESFLTVLRRKNPFKGNRPGLDWIRNFENRWKQELGKRKPELTKARAEGMSEDTLDKFFQMYEDLLLTHDLLDKPNRIYNLDEAGLSTDPRAAKVFVPKSARTAYLKSASCGKTNFSILFCVNASGEYLPPFIVYKGLHLYNTWTVGGPPGTMYGVTPSGWMQDMVFESWFKLFVKSVEDKEKPVLLIFDGHGSHLTYQTVLQAMENQIILLCLPPNTSHALQPLDVGVFAPLKNVWKDVLKRWFRQTRLQKVDKAVFPSLVKQLFLQISEKNAVMGFKGSGLYPLNKEAVRHRIVATEVSYNQLTDAATSTSTSSVPSPTSQPEHGPSTSNTYTETAAVISPTKVLQNAILEVISPRQSDHTKLAKLNATRKRTRVQAKSGEVLTSEEVADRLRLEEQARKLKASSKKLRGTSKGKKAQIEEQKESSSEEQELDEENEAMNNESPHHYDPEEDSDSGSFTDTSNLKVGSWVLVQYHGKKSTMQYIGQILGEELDNLFSITYLSKSYGGSHYVFPEKEDVDFVDRSQILKQLPEPTMDSRGHYLFE